MISSGEYTRVASVWRAHREILREKHRDDKILSDIYGKKGSSPPRVVLGTSCNYAQSMRDLRGEDSSTKSADSKEKSTKTEMRVIKFNDPSTVAPMAGLMGEAVVPVAAPPKVGGGGGGGIGGTVYKTADRPSQLPNPNTNSRIGIRRSTSGQGISPSTLSSTPTRSSLPSILPSGSPSSSSASSSPFKKEKVVSCTPVKSLLEIAEAPQAKKVDILVNIFEETKPTGGPAHKLRVPVIEDAKVIDVIMETMKVFQKDKGEELGSEPSEFILYVAEDDGRPDEDLPALGPDQYIRKLGKNYCLIPKNTGRKRQSTARAQTTFVKIQLPANEYKTVAFQPDLKIKDLLFQLCNRWNLDATEHALRVGKGSADISPDVTMKDIDIHTNGKNNLVLVKKEMKPEVENTSADLWDRFSAISLKQYEVVKIKGFINRQERILGISGEMITNETPSKKKGKTKRPMRLISDVKSIEMNKRKESQFIIKYTEGKPYVYEAKSPEIAREIVQKVTTCMLLKNNHSS